MTEATIPVTTQVPRISVILNAHAGSGNAGDLRQRVLDGLQQHALQADVTLVTDGAQLIDAARAAIAAGADMVVAGGGDGSINAVASVVCGSTAALGVLPLGTLNHFAKDLGIPLTLEDAIANLAHGQRITIDTGEVNGVLFINNSSLGLYPDIVRDREKQQSRLGRSKWQAFFRAALQVLRRYPFLDVRLQLRDAGTDNSHSQLQRRTPFVFIGNNDYQMTGLRLGSRTSLDAGRLSLYVCHHTGRLGLLRLALQALFGRLQQARDFDMFGAVEIQINTRHRHSRRLRVATDGEVNIMQLPLRYRIRPASLSVIVPPLAASQTATGSPPSPNQKAE